MFPLKYLFKFRPYRRRHLSAVNRHPPGMKELMLQMIAASENIIDFFCTVFAVTDDGMTVCGQMGTDLMGPSGNQLNL